MSCKTRFIIRVQKCRKYLPCDFTKCEEKVLTKWCYFNKKT